MSFDTGRVQYELTQYTQDMELLMTAEGHKGRGSGGMILEHGTGMADEEQVVCYIDASPAGRPLYERHGFVFSKQEKLPMDYHYNFGIRKPKREKKEKDEQHE